MRNKAKLQINVEEFIENRLQESYEKIQQRHDYQEIDNQYFQLFQKVKKELIYNQDLLEQYETLLAEMYEIQLKEAYCTGANDMAKLFLNKELS